jgi:hypothetical protein
MHVPLAQTLWATVLGSRHRDPLPQLAPLLLSKEHEPSALPAQVPAHAVPAPAHPVRLPCGVPLPTGVHIPSDPGISHASHGLSHRLSQQ